MMWSCSSVSDFQTIIAIPEYGKLNNIVDRCAFELVIPRTLERVKVLAQRAGEDEFLFEIVGKNVNPVVAENNEERMIFDNAIVGIMYNKDRIMYKVNPRFAEIYGYPPSALLNESSRMLYRNEDEFLLHDELASPVLKKGGVFRAERQMRRSDGRYFWCSLIGKLIDPENPDGGTIWITEDIDQQKKDQAALQKILTEQKIILDHAMVGIVFLKQRKVTQCNKRFEEIFGYTFDELQGGSSRLWHLSDENWKAAGANCYKPLQNGQIFSGEMLLARKDGSPVWCDVQGRAIDPDDLSKGSIWINMDIHEKKLAQDALNRLLDEQQLILDHAMVGIMYMVDQKLTRCNRRLEQMFGYQTGELEGRSSRQMYRDEDDWRAAGKRCYNALRTGGSYSEEMLLVCKSGKEVWCDVRGKAYDPSDLDKGMIWILIDITARKHADEELRYLAEHDALTGLPNRMLFEERVKRALKHADRGGDHVSLLFIDVDHFKTINDTLGHDQGDIALCHIADRLTSSVRETDTVARFGGDEFVILLTHVHSETDIEALIDKLQKACSAPIILGSQVFQLTLSIGGSMYPRDASDFISLMKHADIAMYRSKSRGRNCFQVFNDEMLDHLKS